MKYSSVTNPSFISEDGQVIKCDVQFDHLPAPVPFIARATDPAQHGKEIFQRAKAGEFGEIAAFVETEETTSDVLSKEEAVLIIANLLNTEAKKRGYDDIVSACSYAAGPNPFQKESLLFLEWRGNVWQKFFKMWAYVENGASQSPRAEELLSVLPPFSV